MADGLRLYEGDEDGRHEMTGGTYLVAIVFSTLARGCLILAHQGSSRIKVEFGHARTPLPEAPS